MVLSLLLPIVVSTIVAWLRWRRRRCAERAVIANVFLCALMLNYIWEIAQLPLFESMANANLLAALRHCAWYTFGDATIVVSLYATGAWGHASWEWGLRLRRADWLWLPLAGMLVAVVMERLALRFDRWQYGADMPVIPGLAVGLLPFVQMGILPLLSVLLAARLLPKADRATSRDGA